MSRDKKDAKRYAIVADVGGTNARFARVNLKSMDLDKIEIYPCDRFNSLLAVFKAYQSQHQLDDISHAAVAIACPVQQDEVKMTNLKWTFSIQSLQLELKLQQLFVLNDFCACAQSLMALKKEDRVQIGGGNVIKSQPAVIVGAGTGLGVAYLIPANNGFHTISSEAGHIDWAAQNDEEWQIYSYLKQKYNGHVSVERLLSGMGIENIYQALAQSQSNQALLSASDIAKMALSNQCDRAYATFKHFFAILGRYVGDLALIANTLGGVYIAGGIVPKMLPLLLRSDFRDHFEAKGRFRYFNEKVATYVITNPYAGLLGAAIYLKQNTPAISDL